MRIFISESSLIEIFRREFAPNRNNLSYRFNIYIIDNIYPFEQSRHSFGMYLLNQIQVN